MKTCTILPPNIKACFCVLGFCCNLFHVQQCIWGQQIHEPQETYTVLLPYYPTASLPYYLTTLLPYYLTTLLSYYPTTQETYLLPYYLPSLPPYLDIPAMVVSACDVQNIKQILLPRSAGSPEISKGTKASSIKPEPKGRAMEGVDFIHILLICPFVTFFILIS